MYVDVRILLKKQKRYQQDDGLRGAQEAKNLALALEERARSWTTSSVLICNDCV